MLGLVENLGMVEDICFHEQEKSEELHMPPRLLAVGCTQDEPCQQMGRIRCFFLVVIPIASVVVCLLDSWPS